MFLSLSLFAFTSKSLFLRLLLPQTPHMHYFKEKKVQDSKDIDHRPKGQP